MANKDDTCFRVFTIMFKLKNLRREATTKHSKNYYSYRSRHGRQRRIDISNVRQKENKAYLLDILSFDD